MVTKNIVLHYCSIHCIYCMYIVLGTLGRPDMSKKEDTFVSNDILFYTRFDYIKKQKKNL